MYVHNVEIDNNNEVTETYANICFYIRVLYLAQCPPSMIYLKD